MNISVAITNTTSARNVIVELPTTLDSATNLCYTVDVITTNATNSLRFLIGNGVMSYRVMLNGDYNDGLWHYFVARYDAMASGANSAGMLSLKTLDWSRDGMVTSSANVVLVPSSFQLVSSKTNLYVGRSSTFEDTFQGYLDEIRVSSGLVEDMNLLGYASGQGSARSQVSRCAGTVTLTNLSGSVSDGSGNLEYADNLVCFWLIAPISFSGNPSEKYLNLISLEFQFIGTEPGVDLIQIYDGQYEQDPLLGSFSGYSLPCTTIESSSEYLLVKFTSDGSQRGIQSGFNLSYITHQGEPPDYY